MGTTSRRRSVIAASAVAASALFAGCSASDAEEPVTTVSLYYSAPIIENAIAQIALDHDLYPDDVDVDVQGGDSTLGVTLAASGRAQVYLTAAPGHEQITSGGGSLAYAANYIDGMSAMLIARNGVTSFDDVEGATIGIIQPGLTLAVIADAALREAGHDPSEVTTLSLGTLPAVNSAFAAGTVDVVATNAAAAEQFLQSVPDAVVLRDFREDFAFIGAGVSINSDFAAEHPAAISGVLEGLNAALELFHSDPAAVRDTVGSFTGLSDAALDAAIEIFLDASTSTLQPVTVEQEEAVLAELLQSGYEWAEPSFAETMIADPAYLEDALG